MEPKESYETRLKMAEMHDAALRRIDDAYKEHRYIEVCWLCYACFESRVNRSMAKIISGCPKESRTKDEPIGITTKLDCYNRLLKSGYSPLSGESKELINAIKGWCKERNKLVHGLITLEQYNNIDKTFENLARRGITLVKRMYGFSTDLREFYYSAESIPPFGEEVYSKCHCTQKCLQEE